MYSYCPLPLRKIGGSLLIGLSLLAGCGQSDSPAVPITDSSGAETTSESTTKSTSTQSVEYADVATIALSDLGLPTDINPSQISVDSGTASGLTIKEGEIRFVTGSDPGVDSSVTLKITLSDHSVLVPIVVHSARPVEVVTEIEPDDNGQLPDTAKNANLVVKGLGLGNALQPTSLSFSVSGAPQFDPGASSATIYVPSTGATIDLAKSWTLDAASNTLTISASQVSAILSALPSGELAFDIGLTSKDGEFAVSWTFLAHKPTATIRGTVIAANGSAQTAAAGRLVAIRGLTTRTRLVSVVDESGNFEANGIDAGTYQLVLLDTSQPDFWTASVPVFANSTTVDATLQFNPASETSNSLAAKNLKSAQSAGNAGNIGTSVLVSATTQQNGSSDTLLRQTESDTRMTPQSATPASCETAGAEAGEASYSAKAANQNTTISCVINHSIPAGIAKVQLTLTVFTEEYPTYTTKKSQYNDTWAYAVSGLSGVPSTSGAVNDTHYTKGTITQEYCVDVSTQTKNGNYTFQANLSATNIGDSALPTTVALAVAVSCKDTLKVTKAEFTSPNVKGFAVIKPISGGLPGHYISIPVVTAVSDWGLPLKVEYEPKNASISKVRIGVVVAGKALMSDINLLDAVTSKSAGKLTFSNIVIPRMAQTFSGKTNVVIELTGKVDDNELISTPLDGTIKFGGEASFVPLFLAGDEVTGARRYGQDPLDPGLDSWATYNTIAWLKAKAYRYNDISALHVAQQSDGYSVLFHHGHSDGTQIDMRYSDGEGGYSEALGGASNGASIKKMLVDAAAEVAAGGSDPKPRLSLALAWIKSNRAMFEKESSGARKMHAGPSWMKLALYDGEFPDGTTIPGIGPDGKLTEEGPGSWSTKPSNLSFIAPHLHHWHISLNGV